MLQFVVDYNYNYNLFLYVILLVIDVKLLTDFLAQSWHSIWFI